ncbi:hypothetical protein DPMN_192007 [Dreissena polymorpha]|uniref:Uncharacterized protein n=1 Tax=Dreissena polymorpha TaxID=45954 RepID=A0A9D4BDZ8_DREPO|nr:hypothetical protein DPMN_192007 [Dreissena polymorpha]
MKRKSTRKKTATSTTCACCKGSTANGDQTISVPARPTEEPVADQTRGFSIPTIPDNRAYPFTATVSSTQHFNTSQGHSDIQSATSDVQQLLTFGHPSIGNLPTMPTVDNHMDDSSSSDEDPGFSFLQAVHAHARDIKPGTGQLFAEPLSNPIMRQIKKSVCKDIWHNKYVEMALLLPSALSQQSQQYTLQLDNDSQISFIPKSNLKKITNIEKWYSCHDPFHGSIFIQISV